MAVKTENKETFIKNWQIFLGIAGLIFSGGVFYSKMTSLQEKVSGIDEKVNKQYETQRKTSEAVIDLQKIIEWEKGMREGEERASKINKNR